MMDLLYILFWNLLMNQFALSRCNLLSQYSIHRIKKLFPYFLTEFSCFPFPLFRISRSFHSYLLIFDSQSIDQQYNNITDQKMEQSLHLSSSLSQNKQSKNENRIVIGYYNLRGKAQVCRLLCEYLGVEYQDKLFNLAEWQRFSSSEKVRDWPFPCLPYLRQGSFLVTQSVPMCVYIINRFGTQDLLGRSIKDQGIVDMYIWTIEYMSNVITINCQQKSAEQLKRFKEQQWTEKVYPRLLKIEEAVVGKEWFLDYLTIIDFSVYELNRYMDCIFDNQTCSLPKLKRIEERIRDLPAIKEYEESSRAIVEWCPTKLLEGLKSMTNRTPSN